MIWVRPMAHKGNSWKSSSSRQKVYLYVEINN
uniref:Uncharacterized protein n=1 Tax=Parascaris equorum TaxID=6256 RepID=A0A914RKX7_PAREQ